MQHTCKNCSHKFKDKFCGFCGQSANTYRMDMHSMWHDIQHGILHIDKGFFYTIYQLFSQPGHTIREFLEGKRIKHFKPISLVFILAGVYALLYHYFDIDITTQNEGKNRELTNFFNIINKWSEEHYSLDTLLKLPFLALSIFTAFKKMGYNYVETFIIASYITAQELMLSIVLFPITYMSKGTQVEGCVVTVSLVLYLGIIFRTLFQFFNKYDKKIVFFRTALVVLINIVVIMIVYLLVLLTMWKLGIV